LNETISGMSARLQRTLGDDIELVAQLDPELGRVSVDRGQLEQVLIDLALNARDAMPSGGRLTLTTAKVDILDTWLSFHDGPAPRDYVELSVRDDGAGMSDEVKRHLFEPFFTTKRQGKHAGLGLSSAHGFIRQSGGEIQVDSILGEGSTIRIFLPRVDPKPAVEKPDVMAAVGGDGTTILLVDTEEALRRLVTRTLAKRGFDVVAARSGEEALSVMESHSREVTLLLADSTLPDLTGRELFERLRTRFRDLRVIYLRGGAKDETGRNGDALDRGDFLEKPFEPKRLIEKVTQVLEMT
jgi:CheY-like chemotaxis protein